MCAWLRVWEKAEEEAHVGRITTTQGGTMTRNRLGWSVVVTALTLLTAGPALAQSFPPTSFLTPTKATWESTRTLVLGIAELFPEDKYDFKPTPAVRTLRENLIHLIGENYFFFSKVSGETLPNNSRFNALKSRDEILKELRASYDYDAKVWDSLTEERRRSSSKDGTTRKCNAGRSFSGRSRTT
jgi:hypothetical protein